MNRKDTVTIVDNRTGKTAEIPIVRGAIKGLFEHNTVCDNFFVQQLIWGLTFLSGLMIIAEMKISHYFRSYDPGYLNTASATSKISYIDGDKGILTYRGYPIEELAEKSNFLEVAFLLINGELPNKVSQDNQLLMEKKIRNNSICGKRK